MIETHTQIEDKHPLSGEPLRCPKETHSSELDESTPRLRDYDALDFKELLAACPLDGIELTRATELPRAADL